MKIGSIVRNVHPVRANFAANGHHNGNPIKPGHMGTVLSVKQTSLNSAYNLSEKGDVYIDVVLSVDGESVACGNHLSGTFEIVI